MDRRHYFILITVTNATKLKCFWQIYHHSIQIEDHPVRPLIQSSTSMSESAYIDIEQDALQTLLNKLNSYVPIFCPSLFPFVMRTSIRQGLLLEVGRLIQS